VIAVSKLIFWPMFSYLSPVWEMLFDLLFLWMIILVNPIDVLILLWYCSQLSICYFSPNSAVYSSSGVVCSGLPIFLKFPAPFRHLASGRILSLWTLQNADEFRWWKFPKQSQTLWQTADLLFIYLFLCFLE
jgi:hypothetical protein